MIDLVGAALGPTPGRVLLLAPSAPLLSGLARRAEALVVVEVSPRKAKRHAAARSPDATPTLSVRGDLGGALPFCAGAFDALVCLGGAPDVEDVAAFRRLVRPGGTLLFIGRVRAGVAGGAASLVRRAARSEALPRASDLTAAMLRAGLRPVRQASVKGAVVPEVVTWAEVRRRPWETLTPT